MIGFLIGFYAHFVYIAIKEVYISVSNLPLSSVSHVICSSFE